VLRCVPKLLRRSSVRLAIRDLRALILDLLRPATSRKIFEKSFQRTGLGALCVSFILWFFGMNPVKLCPIFEDTIS